MEGIHTNYLLMIEYQRRTSLYPSLNKNRSNNSGKFTIDINTINLKYTTVFADSLD